MSSLRISEIFHSLQGEGVETGRPTVFVRLTGCPLRCRWCDTSYAFRGGESLTVDEICDRVAAWSTPLVTVTGGEPLAQAAAPELVGALCDLGRQVSVETSGALDIGGLDPRARVVMDLKPPGSGEAHRNRYENLDRLRAQDQIKFVIADRADYEWSREQLKKHRLDERCEVLFSPVWERQAPAQLAQWILDDQLPVRFQLQLHKILWGEEPGR